MKTLPRLTVALTQKASIALMFVVGMGLAGCGDSSTGPDAYATGSLAGNWNCSFEWYPQGRPGPETEYYGMRMEHVSSNQYTLIGSSGSRYPVAFEPPATLYITWTSGVGTARIENDNMIRFLSTGVQNNICRR